MISEATALRGPLRKSFYFIYDMDVAGKDSDGQKPAKTKKPGVLDRFMTKMTDWVKYAMTGVWNDPRRTAKVRMVKIGNLAVSSFFDRDLQLRSMSLTYSTVLSTSRSGCLSYSRTFV